MIFLCKVVSDIFPHELYFNLLKTYDVKKLEKITEDIKIHKLNYKLNYEKKNLDSTLLGYLFKEYQI